MTPPSLAALSRERYRRRLANGLEVLVAHVPGSELVTAALFYRAGCRDETPAEAGISHFVEHLMFKGSERYGPGEIDRRTQALGGVNNAYTSHDATVYYFKLAADRWTEALDIEADRMAGLRLDPREVDAERQVILEEIAGYADDPWDALEQEVLATLFGSHPYGRPVLGTPASLAAIGSGELAAFHRRWYRPANALLVVAGGVGDEALDLVEGRFAALPAAAGAPSRATVLPAPPTGPRRVERDHGEVARLFLALPAPAPTAEAFPGLRLAATALAGGRTSRLHQRLVEEEELCLWVSADVAEQQLGGAVTVAAELHEEAAPAAVEAAVREELARLGREPLPPAELARVRRTLLADWVFSHDQIHHQALSLGFGAALFTEDLVEEALAATLAVEADSLAAVAARWLDPERGGVVGWARPEGRR